MSSRQTEVSACRLQDGQRAIHKAAAVRSKERPKPPRPLTTPRSFSDERILSPVNMCGEIVAVQERCGHLSAVYLVSRLPCRSRRFCRSATRQSASGCADDYARPSRRFHQAQSDRARSAISRGVDTAPAGTGRGQGDDRPQRVEATSLLRLDALVAAAVAGLGGLYEPEFIVADAIRRGDLEPAADHANQRASSAMTSRRTLASISTAVI